MDSLNDLLDTPIEDLQLVNDLAIEKALENIKALEHGISMINRKECDIRETAKALYLDMRPQYEKSRGSKNEDFMKRQTTVYGHIANGHQYKAGKALEKYIKHVGGQISTMISYLEKPSVRVEGTKVVLFNFETVPVWTKKLTLECDLMTLMVKNM